MTDANLSHSTGVIAFLLGFAPRSQEFFSSIIINSLLARMSQYHKKLLLYGQFDFPNVEEFCQDLLNSRVEGLIFVPPSNGTDLAPLLELTDPIGGDC